MQEKTKKRHNPEINEEDLAVKAFDTLESVIEKSDKVVEQEFLDLVKNCFGNLYVEENNYEKLSKTNSLESMTLYDKSWFKKHKSITLEVDIPEPVIKSDAGEVKNKFVETKKYNPIKVTAHTRKSLEQAKKFAIEYKKISEQNVRIVKDFVEEKLEEKVESADVKTLKVMGRKARNFTAGLTKFWLVPFYVPTAVRKGIEEEKNLPLYLFVWKDLAKEGGPAFLLGAITQTPIIIGLCASTSSGWPLLLYPITNGLSGLYEWYRYEKNKLVEK